MRVLMVSPFGYVRGGLERVMFEEVTWLRDAGHEVEYFATADERNEPSDLTRFFPTAHDYSVSGRPSVAAVLDLFWNKRAADAFGAAVDAFRPDVIHSHGIGRHLSPSILPEARSRRVPVVLTAHDYGLVCPAVTLLRGGRTLCKPRACGRRFFGAALAHRCIQGSIPRSALGAMEATYQHVRRQQEDFISRVICPSRFMADRLAEGGVPGSRLVVIGNAVREMRRVAHAVRHEQGPFVVAGRLAPQKGVVTALEAARRAEVQIVVAGTGPLFESLTLAYPEAVFTGSLDTESLWTLLATATAAVVPSEWYENASMAVLEAMAVGVPIVASRIGGIPEQITDGREGLLVPPGDVEAFAEAMRRLWVEPGLAGEMGERAREAARERFSPTSHVAALVEVYADVVGSGVRTRL